MLTVSNMYEFFYFFVLRLDFKFFSKKETSVKHYTRD